MKYWYLVTVGDKQEITFATPAENADAALETMGFFAGRATAEQANWGMLQKALGCEIPHDATELTAASGSLLFYRNEQSTFIRDSN